MRSIPSLLAGVVIGVLATPGAYVFVNRDTVVYEARQTVIAEGIVIPKGTKLIHDTTMSEGFDTLRIYVNVDPVALDTEFTRTVDDRALLVIPYWVNANGQPKPTSGGASNSPQPTNRRVVRDKHSSVSESCGPRRDGSFC